MVWLKLPTQIIKQAIQNYEKHIKSWIFISYFFKSEKLWSLFITTSTFTLYLFIARKDLWRFHLFWDRLDFEVIKFLKSSGVVWRWKSFGKSLFFKECSEEMKYPILRWKIYEGSYFKTKKCDAGSLQDPNSF